MAINLTKIERRIGENGIDYALADMRQNFDTVALKQ